MKQLLTITLILSSVLCFGQAQKKENSTTVSGFDSVEQMEYAQGKRKITPNAVQVEKLNTAYSELNEKQKQINDLIELIIGYKIDEVDSLRIDDNQFKFVLKPKNK